LILVPYLLRSLTSDSVLLISLSFYSVDVSKQETYAFDNDFPALSDSTSLQSLNCGTEADALEGSHDCDSLADGDGDLFQSKAVTGRCRV
jgi:hypothetical protein